MQKIKGKYVLFKDEKNVYFTDSPFWYYFFTTNESRKKINSNYNDPYKNKYKHLVNSRLWTFNGEIIKGNNIKHWTLEAMIEEYKSLAWKYQFKPNIMKQLNKELRKLGKRLEDE